MDAQSIGEEQTAGPQEMPRREPSPRRPGVVPGPVSPRKLASAETEEGGNSGPIQG